MNQSKGFIDTHSDTGQVERLMDCIAFSKVLASICDMETLLREVLQRLNAIIAAKNWSLLLIDPKTKELYFAVVVGVAPEAVKDIRLKPGEGVAGAVVETAQPIIIPALPVNGYPGNTYCYLRLNADGTVDDSYPKRSAPGGFVRAAQVYPATDPTYPNCVRLLGAVPRFSDPSHLDYMVLLGSNGTTVLSSIGDEIINGAILQMWTQGDGKIVIVGTFNQVYGATMNGVAPLASHRRSGSGL